MLFTAKWVSARAAALWNVYSFIPSSSFPRTLPPNQEQGGYPWGEKPPSLGLIAHTWPVKEATRLMHAQERMSNRHTHEGRARRAAGAWPTAVKSRVWEKGCPASFREQAWSRWAAIGQGLNFGINSGYGTQTLQTKVSLEKNLSVNTTIKQRPDTVHLGVSFIFDTGGGSCWWLFRLVSMHTLDPIVSSL